MQQQQQFIKESFEKMVSLFFMYVLNTNNSVQFSQSRNQDSSSSGPSTEPSTEPETVSVPETETKESVSVSESVSASDSVSVVHSTDNGSDKWPKKKYNNKKVRFYY